MALHTITPESSTVMGPHSNRNPKISLNLGRTHPLSVTRALVGGCSQQGTMFSLLHAFNANDSWIAAEMF